MSWWRCFGAFVKGVSRPRQELSGPEEVVPSALTAPEVTVAAHLSAAREAFLRQEPEACAKAALDALARDPDDLFAGFYLGQARLRQGRLYEALQAFEAAADHDPFGFTAGWLEHVQTLLAAQCRERDDPAADAAIELERAARAALRAGDWPAAGRLAAEAVARDPSNLLAHHQLGRALLAQGQREQALAVYEAARPFDAGLGLVDGWLRQALSHASEQARPTPNESGED